MCVCVNVCGCMRARARVVPLTRAHSRTRTQPHPPTHEHTHARARAFHTLTLTLQIVSHHIRLCGTLVLVRVNHGAVCFVLLAPGTGGILYQRDGRCSGSGRVGPGRVGLGWVGLFLPELSRGAAPHGYTNPLFVCPWLTELGEGVT